MANPRITVTVNRRQLMKEMTSSSRPTINQVIVKKITPQIHRAQNQMVKDFLDHPVSKEIKAGPNSSNSSGLLGGYGNLFSFFGFEQGTSPITDVKEMLNRPLSIKARKDGDYGKFNISITGISKEEILTNTPFHWMSGRSWIDGVEKGVAGFGRYLYLDSGYPDSRSGTGIQYKGGQPYAGRFQNTPYLSEIINNFKKKIRAR
jgi:hypothetical protein